MIYDLQEARIVSDRGTAGSVKLTAEGPVIVIPAEDIVIHSGSEVYRVGRGRFILLRSSKTDWYIDRAEEADYAVVYAVHFESYRLIEQSGAELRYRVCHQQLPEHGSVMEFPRQAQALLDDLIVQARISASVRGVPRLNLMLEELIRTALVNSVYMDVYLTKDPAMGETLAHIHRYFGAALTRSAMAKTAGFNASYFSSLFRKETGWSFTEYVNRIRIDEAKRLLLRTPETLQEIAMKTGFSDGAYLAKTFRRTVHLPPSDFRRRQRTLRVAAMQFLGALLAVGVRPVAATKDVLRSSNLLREDLRGIAEMEELHDLDKLKATKPELIVAPTYYYRFPETLKELEKVAPVVMVEWGAMDKLEEVRTIGRLLGRTSEAERWIEALRIKAKLARRAISRFVRAYETAGIYELRYDHSWLIPSYSVRSAYNLYRLLAMKPVERIAREVLEPNRHLFVPERSLQHYAASHMFLIMPHENLDDGREELMSRGIWQRLTAQGCKLHLLRLNDFWMDEGVSLERQLDTLADLLTGSRWSQQNNVSDNQQAYIDARQTSPI
ncbi:helix-turn-helix domain-containing protein [Cohnella boryungensis]